MKKKNFILIAISIILQCIPIMIPFIGFGEKVELVSLPATLLVSLLLLYFGLKGLYKDTNYSEFNSGAVLAIVGLFALVIGTMISPLIVGGNYVGIIEFYSVVFNNVDNDGVVIYTMLNFIKSFGAFFLMTAVSACFYGYALARFATGIKYQKIDKEHTKKLSRSVKQFGLYNFLSFALLTGFFFIMHSMLKLIFINMDAQGNVSDALTGQLLTYLVLIYFVLMPVLIWISVTYIINLIKSLIFVFSTPKKIQESIEVIEPQELENEQEN